MSITATDRIRVEHAIAAMYRTPWARPRLLIEQAAEELGCSRRQLERAFAAFRIAPAEELRSIRCELAAACLVESSWDETAEKAIGQRLGLSDDRALRRLIGGRWNIAPSCIREAAKLQRHLAYWERASLRHRETGAGGLSYGDELRRVIKEVLEGAPIEIRRLIDGDVSFPLPRQAVKRRHSLAQERVAQHKEVVLHEAELVA